MQIVFFPKSALVYADAVRRAEPHSPIPLSDQGHVITPSQLPTSVKDLRDDPFRSLAGAVRAACGFSKKDSYLPDSNYLEFKWADYLRENWSKTNIPVDEINANFDNTAAALQLAIEKEAIVLPGYTGKSCCH